jgi:hypothetical protein
MNHHFTHQQKGCGPQNHNPFPHKKGRRNHSGADEAREMRSSESDKSKRFYLLSAIGLVPRSRRLLTAVRAARTVGIPAAAAP